MDFSKDLICENLTAEDGVLYFAGQNTVTLAQKYGTPLYLMDENRIRQQARVYHDTLRECYVVAQEGADLARIEREIKEMPNYFADYDTTVTFITAEELAANHSGIPHGGFVIRTGVTGKEGEHKHTIEYSLKLDSNPEFTASVLVAYARAVYKAAQRGERGCKTVFDVAPADLSPLSAEELRAKML